jgi:YVTN family beta-propeller protein
MTTQIRTFLTCLFLIIAIFQSRETASADQDRPEANPKSIAIEPYSNRAVVADEKSGTISLISLPDLSSITVAVTEKGRSKLAIYRTKNIALITNTRNNTVEIFDLKTFAVDSIPVGRQPEGIAVHKSLGLALVANSGDNSVSVIDLSEYTTLTTVSAGNGPKSIAVDEGLKIALAANEKDQSISVIDLSDFSITDTIILHRKPRAIDINSEDHKAYVISDTDLTVIDLSTFQTTSIPVCGFPVDLAVNPLDNHILVICDEERKLVLIDPYSLSVIQEYSLNKLPGAVAVNNFTNIAAVVDDKTDNITLINLPNPIPVINSLSSHSAARGSSELQITITGRRFIAESIAYLGNHQLTTAFIDNHHLEITISRELLVDPGIFQIRVLNPEPSGGISNSIDFRIDNPVPFIAAIEPFEAQTGASGLTLNIYGSGFFEDTLLYADGLPKDTVYKSKTRLESLLKSEDLKKSGTIMIATSNPAPGGGFSNTVSFTVKPSKDEIRIISPGNGDSIKKQKIRVKGIFKSKSKEIRIDVNGTRAQITGAEWDADVTLTSGVNTLTANLWTPESVATDSIMVFGMEALETSYNSIWDGGGSDNLASTPANWTGDVLPQSGSTVIFDATSKNCVWDLEETYHALVIDGGYGGAVIINSPLTLSGESLTLNAPASLTASAVSGRIDLSWTDNSEGELGFRIERRTGTEGNYIQIGTVGPDETEYADTDALLALTTYYYRVRAYDAFGYSSYSNEASATTSASAPSVSTEAAGNLNGDSVRLNGTVNASGAETSVYFQWGTTTAYGNTTPSVILSPDPVNEVISADITGLSVSSIYHYRAVAANSLGTTYGGDMEFTTPPITVHITSPVSGSTINRPDIMVTGSLPSTAGNETGVTVNGMAAMVYGNQFVVNHVPLTEGINTIKIIATDTEGNTATTEFEVTADTAQPYVALTANTESGISPLTVAFSASTAIPNSATTYNMDYDGNATIDYTGSTFNEISHLYSSPGIYFATLTVVDSASFSYTDTVGIVVMNLSDLDALLRAKWNAMKSHLANQNISQALNYHTEESRATYNAIYTALGSQLPQDIQAMQEIQMVYSQDNIAKYRIRKNETYGGNPMTITYYIYFVKDNNGIWTIYKY